MQLLARPALPPDFANEWQIQNLVLTAPQAAAGVFTLESEPRLDDTGDPLLEVKLNGVPQTIVSDYTLEGVTVTWVSEVVLAEGDDFSLSHLSKTSLAIWDEREVTLSAQNVADGNITLVSVPRLDEAAVKMLAVYYDGGTQATETVDYTMAAKVLTWISGTAWVAGKKLNYWFVPA